MDRPSRINRAWPQYSLVLRNRNNQPSSRTTHIVRGELHAPRHFTLQTSVPLKGIRILIEAIDTLVGDWRRSGSAWIRIVQSERTEGGYIFPTKGQRGAVGINPGRDTNAILLNI